MTLDDLKEEHPDLLWVTRSGYERVLPKLTRMINKAAKSGLPMPELRLEQEVTIERVIRAGTFHRNVRIPYVGVMLIGEPIILGGWKFVATIQHTEEGNILHRPFGDRDTPIPKRYRSTSTKLCEHCHTRRKRNDTYLVFNIEDEVWKQVGRTCLKDHCGGHDPAAALFAADAPQRIANWFGEESVSDRYVPTVDTEDFIISCVTAARQSGGYVSVDSAKGSSKKPTGEAVWRGHASCDMVGLAVFGALMETRTEQDEKYGRAARAWAMAFPEKVDCEYYSNLRTTCCLDEIPERNVNLVASVIQSFKEELECRKAGGGGVAGLVPTSAMAEGNRYGFGMVTFRGAHAYYKDYGYGEVQRFVVTFRDRLGRPIKWFTSSSMSTLNSGDLVTLNAEFIRTSEWKDEVQLQIKKPQWRKPGDDTEDSREGRAMVTVQSIAARLDQLSLRLDEEKKSAPLVATAISDIRRMIGECR